MERDSDIERKKKRRNSVRERESEGLEKERKAGKEKK